MLKQQNAECDDSKLKEIGSRIQNLRKGKKLTIEKLAEKSNLSVQSICKIEAGTRNFKVQSLIAISQALGVSCDYILGLSSYSEDDNIVSLVASTSTSKKKFIKQFIELYLSSELNGEDNTN